MIKGTYFFTIEQDYESTGVGNYSIVFTFNSSNESFAETYSTDNDSIYNASRIQLNKKYLGQIAENEEVDIYVFNVSSNSGFKIAYNSNIDGNGQNLYLFDKEGNTLDSWIYYKQNHTTKKTVFNKIFNYKSGKYYFAVEKDYEGTGTGNYDLTVSQIIKVAKPSILKCTARSTNTQKVAWNKVADVTGYQVQCSNGGTKWAQTKVTTGNTALFTGLIAGGKYKFRVRAYKRIDGINYFSAWSPVLNSCAKPANVTLKSVSSPKHTQIKSVWSKAGGVVSGYQIVYSRNKAFTNIAARKNVSGKSTVTYTGKNFTKDRNYYVAVRAYTSFAGKVYYGKYSSIKAVKCQ